MDVLNDGISDVHIIDSMGSDESVVRAARVSFSKDDDSGFNSDKDSKLIHYLAKHDHGTPFEHTSITFHVACPLFIRGQWHRHRIGWSYNEVSRRYTEDDIQFYFPPQWRGQAKSNRQASEGVLQNPYLHTEYAKAMYDSLEYYHKFITSGVSREMARMILPQSMYTRFYATCNLRSLAHFVKLRSDSHAQPEIRAYSDAMYEQTKAHFPISMEALIEAR